jgi:hypothetical protein
MATQDIQAPTVGAQGEPCATCGAPLAADQRYCLECGTRRADAWVPFREILAGKAAAPAAAAPPAPAEPPPSNRTGLAFLGGLACLLLALGVGVLIGNSGDKSATPASNPPPQVIRVGGASTAPATTTTAPDSSTTTTTGDSSTSTHKGSSSSSKSGSSKDTSSSSSSDKGSSGSKAKNKSIQDLNKSSGSDYQKKADKLPKQTSTGGKPPPKDTSKPAGGGSDFQTIG